MENQKLNGSSQIDKVPAQRKTTLKWGTDGELSAIDKARILERLSNQELTECDFACAIEEHQKAS